ncbi:3-phosphoshikimate 1-carboxyvinyltransferase [Mycoplasmatota bacterium WC30]
MRVEVYPSKVDGTIVPPPSKSVLHRSIISAALSKGTSLISNIIYSEDVLATINAFKSIGVSIIEGQNTLIITSSGIGEYDGDLTINCNESGSTMRFLIPVLSNNKNVYFKGKSSLINRPMTIYESIFKDQKLEYQKTATAIRTKGRLSPGTFKIPGDVSSQFISGLLFILPTLNGDSTIEVEGNLESANYIEMTIATLKKFGVTILKAKNIFKIKGNQHFTPANIEVETDFSQLAFYAVLGIINNNVQITNINYNSLQPDKKIIEIIESMGGEVSKETNSITFKKSFTIGKTIDVSQCPDIAPILGILAAHSKGQTNIINAKRLIIKESNRLLSTYLILKKFGVQVTMDHDSLSITGTDNLKGNIFDSFNDHRIAMSLSIAATIADSKVTINNAEAVNKSYPDFYKDLQSLGVKIKYL